MAAAAQRTVTFYTSNPGKLREARAALAPHGWRVVARRARLVEPQADRLEEVAKAKLAQAPRARAAVMVEDAGLFIPSLGGFPGVYSAYVHRTLGPEGILKLVQGRDRRASFRAVVAFRRVGPPRLFVGEVQGTLSPRVRGRGGFGFDPIFVPDGERRTFAEMSTEEKLTRSHRGKAMASLARYLGSRRS